MDAYVLAAVIVFASGLYALVSKRNLIKSLVGVVLMVESSHLIFISSSPLNALAQYFVIVSMVITGGLMVVVIGFVITVYRRTGTIKNEALEPGD